MIRSLTIQAVCSLSAEERTQAHRRLMPPFHDDQPPRPEFDPTTPANVTALVGRDATLTCIVRNIGNHTVSWIRQTDLHILTAGRYTYTTDLRFEAFHSPGSSIWMLSIKSVRSNDTGLYDCQISTKPELSLEVQFNVVVPVARILGGRNVFIQRESDLNLTCLVSYSPEPPTSVEWLHRNQTLATVVWSHSQVVSFSSSRGGISVITAKGHRTTSHLLLQRASAADSGEYVCRPNNAEPASVTVHILDGEQPAAMQTGSSSFAASGSSCLCGLVLSWTVHRLLAGVR